jgi:hypothetical protein
MLLVATCVGVSMNLVLIGQVSCWILSFWAFDEDENDDH